MPAHRSITGDELRALGLLRAAMANEMAIDRLTVEAYGLRVREPLPRPLRLPAIVKAHPILQTILYRVLAVSWPLLGSALASRQAITALRIVAQHDPHARPSVASMVVCSNLADQSGVTSYDGMPKERTWLRLPGQVSAVPAGERMHETLDLATREDVVWAWRWALSEIWKRSRIGRGGSLQTYVAFRFLLAYRVLARLAQDPARTIAFSSQLDRWAVLIDGVTGPSKRWFLQHGRLGAHATTATGAADIAVPAFRRRLSRVSKVVDFSDQDRETIRKFYLAPHSVPQFDRNVLGAGFELTQIMLRSPLTRSMLLIGEVVQIDRQIALVRSVVARLPHVQVFVKPHPRYPATPYVAELGALPSVEILADPAIYPQCDLTVYAMSFLGDQYRAMGQPTLMVVFDDLEKSVAAIATRLERIINTSTSQRI